MFIRMCYRGLDGHCLGHSCTYIYFFKINNIVETGNTQLAALQKYEVESSTVCGDMCSLVVKQQHFRKLFRFMVETSNVATEIIISCLKAYRESIN
jgi:hypothetical protein